jgi:DNA invertase Pin-like site-specific DNA recombinase
MGCNRKSVRPPTQGLWPLSAEPGPNFRWGIVTRRSQLNADGTENSTRRQEHAVLQYIKDRKLGKVVAVYKDVASIYKEDARRPEADAALADLRAGRIDGIAVWRTDRLVCRAKQYREVLDALEASGGRLLAMVEGIDTADPDRKFVNGLILDLLTRLSEMEREGTAQRMVLMHEERARLGIPPRTQVRPFGMTLDWTKLVDEEVALIKEAAKRVLKGESTYTIVKDWQQRGIKTASGKPWHHDTLKGVLTSARLIAKREYGGTLFDLQGVPRILNVRTWESVRQALAVRNPRPGPKERHQLSNIALCGLCDMPIIGGTDSRYDRPTYICRKRHAYPNACGKVQATESHVDAFIAEQVSDFLNDRTRVMALLRQHAQGAELEALHDRQHELNESLVAYDAALNPPPGKPRMSLERYWAQVEAIEAERTEIQRKLAVTREAALLTETLGIEWSPETWNSQPLEWRRAMLKLITERIELRQPTVRGRKGLYGTEFDKSRVVVKFSA